MDFRKVQLAYRVAKMSSHVHLLQKNCCETRMGVYQQKRIISNTGECDLKKNSASIVFLYCDINQFKTLKVSSPWK